MTEAEITHNTLDATPHVARDGEFNCHARPRAILAAASLPELCTAATLAWALYNAGLHPTSDAVNDEFVDHMCAADDLMLRCIAERPAATLADMAAKARLLQSRAPMDRPEAMDAIMDGLLSDVLALAAREGVA